MSRVAVFDSLELDNELHDLYWREFKQNLNIRNNEHEWEFLLNSIIFLFSTYKKGNNLTTTYALELTSNNLFNATKKTLFVITILKNYINKKLQHLIYNNSNESLLYLLHWFNKIYSLLDLINFLKFLSSFNNSHLFISPIHRLLNVPITRTNLESSSDFYQNTVVSNLQFQNRQLLWNSILELFNMTLLNNSAWLQRKFKPMKLKNKSLTDSTICTRCDEFPSQPYRFQCCQSLYCYICTIKTLDLSICQNCGKDNNLKAVPLY
ncbi:hypothetical protein Kpol_2000p24 [Vanderwaltozyma polyspora DSM 70294]|uniref:Pex N-terminal domain-containing protein n=1 Tax=Vanderwaltozyma polyspora (strain ATCC 22028 / DSM 70294 / BCRC 21397 / CBS 2163 / NBRC 10782 / NRRL Y-8283 / UCD 57-17) TaxID=436907 RepID=A7TF35_VANPO|nr:uncharacterized protein Kpol_2000p24 [Vanderwaltozyma polyspora DSM 70294]EDO19060.1 hypothetical protein Kpol_2000p24 [Vanderwaltozyma polyspora DSM 70294]